MTDRDTFAAAALTGLIVSMREESIYELCESAYGWADAMLRQRGTAVSDNCVADNQPEIPCPPTLTDAEREAVEAAMRSSPFCYTPEAKTLEALLPRLA